MLAEVPTILDGFLTGLANTTNTCVYRGGGWGGGSYKMAGISSVKTENSQMTSFSTSHITQAAKPWPSLSVSHVMIYSQLSAFPGKVEPFKTIRALINI